jgi:hypothetical protein
LGSLADEPLRMCGVSGVQNQATLGTDRIGDAVMNVRGCV